MSMHNALLTTSEAFNSNDCALCALPAIGYAVVHRSSCPHVLSGYYCDEHRDIEVQLLKMRATQLDMGCETPYECKTLGTAQEHCVNCR